MHPNVYINSIRQLSGTNDKIAFFKEYLTPELERIFRLALSSEYTFGVKKIPLYSVGFHKYSLNEALDVLEYEFASNKLTGNARINRLQELLGSTDPDTVEVLKLILNKSLDCGISVTNANKVLTNKIPTFDVLLCSKQDQKLIDKLPFPGTVAQCLSYDWEIETEYGKKKIGDIVENELCVNVWSYNHITNQKELKPITNFMKRKMEKEWFILTVDNKQTPPLTGDHLVWVENRNSYVRVDELQVGDQVLRW